MEVKSLIDMIKEIRGKGVVGPVPTDGYYYEIALKDFNGNLGMYGDIVDKHTDILNYASEALEYKNKAKEWATSSDDIDGEPAGTKSAKTHAEAAASAEALIAPHYSGIDIIESIGATNINTVAGDTDSINVLATTTITNALTRLNTGATPNNIDLLGEITNEINLIGTNEVIEDLSILGTAEVVADLNVVANTTYKTELSKVASELGVNKDVSIVAADLLLDNNSLIGKATSSASLARDWASKMGDAVLSANDNDGITALYSARKYSEDAMNYRDQIASMTAEAVDVPLSGADGNTIGTPTASYNSNTGILTLGIPHGRMQRIESVVPQLEAGVPNGKLTFNFTDGTDYTTPSLKGADGDVGPAGDHEEVTGFVSNGDGTYDISFKYGTTRTTMDITGPQGPAGSPGVDVRSVHWISNSAGSPENTASTVDTYGVYSTTTQDAEAQLGTFTVYNGANGSGVGDMLYSENLAGLTDIPLARTNLGVDSSLQVNNKILVAVPAQSGVISGTCLTTDGSVTSWGYNPNIGSW